MFGGDATQDLVAMLDGVYSPRSGFAFRLDIKMGEHNKLPCLIYEIIFEKWKEEDLVLYSEKYVFESQEKIKEKYEAAQQYLAIKMLSNFTYEALNHKIVEIKNRKFFSAV